MLVAVGSDHAGFEYKEKIRRILMDHDIDVLDFGPAGKDSVDYPDYGLKVARAVASGKADSGVAICWTGNGMAMTANKVKGIRAALCLTPDMVYYARLHNNANVLTLGQKYVKETDLPNIIKTWLETEFEGGRHIARLEKIAAAEKNK
nr:ribose 5-phosphate isomerase B [candidate division Zixibacteria bacterium]